MLVANGIFIDHTVHRVEYVRQKMLHDTAVQMGDHGSKPFEDSSRLQRPIVLIPYIEQVSPQNLRLWLTAFFALLRRRISADRA